LSKDCPRESLFESLYIHGKTQNPAVILRV
jgi:hypothetical protein